MFLSKKVKIFNNFYKNPCYFALFLALKPYQNELLKDISNYVKFNP